MITGNADQQREYNTETIQRSRRRAEEEVPLLLGGQCQLCGFAGLPALRVWPYPKGSYQDFLRRVRLDLKADAGRAGQYQLLCANCLLMQAADLQAGQTEEMKANP